MVITLAQLMVFTLILARIAGIFIDAPLLSARSIPVGVKVGICIWVAATLWFVIPITVLPASAGAFILALLNEVLIGFLIGFVCSIIFSAIQAAGDIIDLQMGLSVATIVSPTTGGVVSIVGQLAFFIGLIAFLAVNGHHMIFSALHQSFRMLPVGVPISPASGKFMVQLFDLGKTLWIIAIQLAAPAVLMIFLSDFAFGIVSRVAPQVNVFMLGFQVKPSLGLIAILLCVPLLVKHIANLVPQMSQEILKLFVNLK